MFSSVLFCGFSFLQLVRSSSYSRCPFLHGLSDFEVLFFFFPKFLVSWCWRPCISFGRRDSGFFLFPSLSGLPLEMLFISFLPDLFLSPSASGVCTCTLGIFHSLFAVFWSNGPVFPPGSPHPFGFPPATFSYSHTRWIGPPFQPVRCLSILDHNIASYVAVVFLVSFLVVPNFPLTHSGLELPVRRGRVPLSSLLERFRIPPFAFFFFLLRTDHCVILSFLPPVPGFSPFPQRSWLLHVFSGLFLVFFLLVSFFPFFCSC